MHHSDLCRRQKGKKQANRGMTAERSVIAIHDDDDSEERFSRKTRSSQENSRNSACFPVTAVPAAAARRRPQILDFETPGHRLFD